jgi:hypothetical protein
MNLVNNRKSLISNNPLDYYELKLKNKGFKVTDEQETEFRYLQRYYWKPTKDYHRMMENGGFFKNTRLRKDLLDSSKLYDPEVTDYCVDVKTRIGKEFQAEIPELS